MRKEFTGTLLSGDGSSLWLRDDGGLEINVAEFLRRVAPDGSRVKIVVETVTGDERVSESRSPEGEPFDGNNVVRRS